MAMKPKSKPASKPMPKGKPFQSGKYGSSKKGC